MLPSMQITPQFLTNVRSIFTLVSKLKDLGKILLRKLYFYIFKHP